MTNFGEEVGFDFNWKAVSACRRTYFNNNLDNFIDFVTVCNTNAACAAPFVTAAGLSPAFTTVNQYNNVGSANFQGFEVIGGWQAAAGAASSRPASRSTSAYLTSTTFPTWNAPASSSARCRPGWSTPAPNGGRSRTSPSPST